jgi:primosomal protein N' (replication factor Y) (superfamily II helicase)
MVSAKTEQQTLFDTAPPPWEQDEAVEQLLATVVFARGPDQPFDYLVPDSLREELEPGRRIRVPFGKSDRLVVGYCVDVQTRRVLLRNLKPVHSLIDQRTLLSPSMLRLTKWMAEYYLCSWGQVLETVVPAGVRQQAGARSRAA